MTVTGRVAWIRECTDNFSAESNMQNCNFEQQLGDKRIELKTDPTEIGFEDEDGWNLLRIIISCGLYLRG